MPNYKKNLLLVFFTLLIICKEVFVYFIFFGLVYLIGKFVEYPSSPWIIALVSLYVFKLTKDYEYKFKFLNKQLSFNKFIDYKQEDINKKD